MARLPVVLVTGFEPFDGESINPSWETATHLHGWKIPPPNGGASIAVVRAEKLPCTFGAALQALDQALTRHHPIAVIGLGLAGSRLDVSVERVAINVDDARIPDNAGRQPIDQPIVADGPAAYFSTLPIKTIVSRLRAAGIPASVSQTAGTFVCNHVFYGLAHRLAAAPGGARGGFIHLPWLPEQAAQGEGRPSMALPTMVEAIRLAIRATLDFGGDDLPLVAGSIA